MDFMGGEGAPPQAAEFQGFGERQHPLGQPGAASSGRRVPWGLGGRMLEALISSPTLLGSSARAGGAADGAQQGGGVGTDLPASLLATGQLGNGD